MTKREGFTMSEELMNDCSTDSCTSDCSSCGCSCGSAAPQPNIVPLAFEDGTVVNCMEITRFDVDGNTYVVLLPLNEDGQNESGSVYVYRFVTDENGQTLLSNIESQEEYEKVSEVFNQMVSSMMG